MSEHESLQVGKVDRVEEEGPVEISEEDTRLGQRMAELLQREAPEHPFAGQSDICAKIAARQREAQGDDARYATLEAEIAGEIEFVSGGDKEEAAGIEAKVLEMYRQVNN